MAEVYEMMVQGMAELGRCWLGPSGGDSPRTAPWLQGICPRLRLAGPVPPGHVPHGPIPPAPVPGGDTSRFRVALRTCPALAQSKQRLSDGLGARRGWAQPGVHTGPPTPSGHSRPTAMQEDRGARAPSIPTPSHGDPSLDLVRPLGATVIQIMNNYSHIKLVNSRYSASPAHNSTGKTPPEHRDLFP